MDFADLRHKTRVYFSCSRFAGFADQKSLSDSFSVSALSPPLYEYTNWMNTISNEVLNLFRRLVVISFIKCRTCTKLVSLTVLKEESTNYKHHQVCTTKYVPNLLNCECGRGQLVPWNYNISSFFSWMTLNWGKAKSWVWRYHSITIAFSLGTSPKIGIGMNFWRSSRNMHVSTQKLTCVIMHWSKHCWGWKLNICCLWINLLLTVYTIINSLLL